MTFEEALKIIEETLATKTETELTTPEKQILKAAWDNETYVSVAESLYLSVGHVRDLASLLWQRLSDAFGEKLIKNNFRYVLRQRAKLSVEADVWEEYNFDDLENQKGTILIVDDLVDNLRFLSEVLTKQGYKVRSVTNGAMALKTVSNNRPDIILLDIKMPVMDGYQVCEALKSSEETSDIPVIFLSALDEVVDKVKAFQVGGVDYIIKPFHPKEIIARIETHLTIQQQKSQLKQQIEKHQQTAEILYQSRSLLASLLNSSPDGIMGLQPVKDMLTEEINNFRCLVINPAFAKFLGKKREDFVGDGVMKKELNKLYPRLFDVLVEVFETGESFEEKLCLKKEGMKKSYRFVAVKFGDGVSLTIRDLAPI
ncbi:response regulator [Ancylothrix sp. C2]|uniref:response regulator n=1 Tax=Ancylothrix sp. D3o TaxID=2953691 RepID=UPI0021BB8D01|nr:response regulator [Ancylothrix sp. D3o]MCT7953034.1 response regulator [Ancylothrix sp. D3o]